MKIEIGSKEWREARRNLITATDAAIIMGVSPFKTPLQLYYDKVNGTDSIQTGAMKRGLDLEPEARSCFEELTGHFVSPQFRVSKDIGWMAASFDGINDEGVVVEIKCPGKEDHYAATRGKVPEKYYPQLQHQMYVAGVHKCFYFSYRPGDLEKHTMIEVASDEEFQFNMIEAEKEFWDRLQNKIPPDSEVRDLQIREDREWISLEDQMLDLLKEKDSLEQREQELRDKMIDLCSGKPTQGASLKFSAVYKKGAVDYKVIPELYGVDLDKFRKPSALQWRMDRI